MKTRYIIFSSLLACLLLYFIEQVLHVDYLTKTVAKIVLFTLVPCGYRYLLGAGSWRTVARQERGQLKAGFFFGLAAFGVVIIAYLLTRDALNLPAIAQEMQDKSKITPTNFLLVGLYITFGNSFLEEFFFRGFIFLSLHQLGKTSTAYIFSSLLFAVYHIAIFQTWFTPSLMALAMVGLVGVGFIFNWLNVRARTFYNSWLAHILADAAIILIGLRMFEMI